MKLEPLGVSPGVYIFLKLLDDTLIDYSGSAKGDPEKGHEESGDREP